MSDILTDTRFLSQSMPSKLQSFINKLKHLLMLPVTIALLLSCLSTAIKTAAWYGQTIIPDESLLPLDWPPHDEQDRDVILTTLKTLLSWSIAFLEYIPLTMANSVANQARISLTNLRGAIEAMDLSWFILFLYFAKSTHLNWHQYTGLALAGMGCAVVNKPDWLLTGFDLKVEATQVKFANGLTEFLERLSHCFKQKAKDPMLDEQLPSSLTSNNKFDVQQQNFPTFVRSVQIEKRLSISSEKLIRELQNVKSKTKQKIQLTSTSEPDAALNNQVANSSAIDTLVSPISQPIREKIEIPIDAPPLMLSDRSQSKDTQSVIKSNQDSCVSHSTEPSLSTRIFFVGWLLGQALFYTLAVFMFLQHKRLLAVLTLTASATGVKTIAWYLHTVLDDQQLLPPSWMPKQKRRKEFALATVKIVMSWFIALGEYIPLTLANRTADNNGISLAKVRGIIETMDLLWLIAFMMMVKHERLQWQHLLGLAMAAIGIAIANVDVDANVDF